MGVVAPALVAVMVGGLLQIDRTRRVFATSFEDEWMAQCTPRRKGRQRVNFATARISPGRPRIENPPCERSGRVQYNNNQSSRPHQPPLLLQPAAESLRFRRTAPRRPAEEPAHDRASARSEPTSRRPRSFPVLVRAALIWRWPRPSTRRRPARGNRLRPSPRPPSRSSSIATSGRSSRTSASSATGPTPPSARQTSGSTP